MSHINKKNGPILMASAITPKALLLRITALCLCLLFSRSALSLSDDKYEELFNMSLESLTQVIVTASKHEEHLFDAPIAANVLSGDKILASGATSIPEALRLVPGVIVREQSNGNYDVHIRGLDNIPPNSEIVRTAINNSTLVMIDNRIVYNHFTGGTFWEQIPVDLHDIDRIEVIKGSTSAMYGPNAMTGVIHIITKDPGKLGGGGSVSVQRGNHDTLIRNGDLYFAIGNVSARMSTHWQRRNRLDDGYFEFFGGEYKTDPGDIETLPFSPGGPLPDPYVKYPSRKNAMERQGINLFLKGEIFSGAESELAIGYQDSEVQKVFDDNGATPLTTVDAKSSYFNLETHWRRMSVRLNHQDGTHDVLGSPFFKFHYENTHLLLDGNWAWKGATIQPLLHYRRQSYSGDSFSGDAEMDIISAGFRSEYSTGKWRYSAAVRGEHFDFSNDTELSYLAGISYGKDDKLLLRASIGRAMQEPLMLHMFEDLVFPGTNVVALGNEDLDLVEMNNIEAGLRWAISHHWAIDTEIFKLESKNYQVLTSPDFTTFQYQNLKDEGQLTGVTVSLTFDSTHWHNSFFITQQKTDLEHAITDENENTPGYYGGLTSNYSGLDKININVNAYFFDDSAQLNARTIDVFAVTPDPVDSIIPEGKVDGKFIVNTRISYQATKQLQFFVNLRNLGDDSSREFAMADETGAIALFGFSWKI